MSMRDYTADFFPDYNEATRDRLMDFMLFLQDLLPSGYYLEEKSAIFGALLNLLHLIVLSRMMTSSVNVIVLGIATCDFLNMLIATVVAHATEFGADDCSAMPSFLLTEAIWASDSLRDGFRRCSAWLGVLMALVRYLILKFISLSAQLSSPTIGKKAIIGSVAVSCVLSILSFFQFQPVYGGEWAPEESCDGVVQNATYPMYNMQLTGAFALWNRLPQLVLKTSDAFASKFVPCLALPILTVLLCLELARTRKDRKSSGVSTSNAKKKNNTTPLVILMTFLFFLSEFPLGIATLVTGISHQSGVLQIAAVFTLAFNFVFIFNSSIHCLLFFLMSSQYRDTVKSLLRLKRASESRTITSKSKSSK